MTVSIIPNIPDHGEINIANGTWFWLLDNTDIGKIVGRMTHVNDPLFVDDEESVKCAEALKKVTPPTSWGNNDLHQMLIDFFENCGGFETF